MRPSISRRKITTFFRGPAPLCLAGVKNPRELRFFSTFTKADCWIAAAGVGAVTVAAVAAVKFATGNRIYEGAYNIQDVVVVNLSVHPSKSV